MKKLLIIAMLLITWSVSSQTTFYNFILENGSENNYYAGITEDINDNFYTLDKIYNSTVEIRVSKFDIFGTLLTENSQHFGTPGLESNFVKEMSFKNDTLFIFASDSLYKPISYKYNSDLTTVDIDTIDFDGCPWRVNYYYDDMTIMCYNGDYLTGEYFTKFITVDYDLNIIDSTTFMDLDPWDFQILNDTIYFSARDENGLFSIKKVIGDTTEDFITFDNNYSKTQFDIINNENFIIVNTYPEYSMLYVYNSQGTEISSDTIFGVFNSEFLKLATINNKAYLSWGNNNSLYLRIIHSDLSVINHTIFDSLSDTSFVVNSINSTDNNVYIYGRWLVGNVHNPFVVKTDDNGTMSMSVGVNEISTEPTFSFFPNPVNDNVTINFKENVSEIYIYDERGRLVYQKNMTSNTLNLSHLKSGVYFITDSFTTYKIIKR